MRSLLQHQSAHEQLLPKPTNTLVLAEQCEEWNVRHLGEQLRQYCSRVRFAFRNCTVGVPADQLDAAMLEKTHNERTTHLEDTGAILGLPSDERGMIQCLLTQPDTLKTLRLEHTYLQSFMLSTDVQTLHSELRIPITEPLEASERWNHKHTALEIITNELGIPVTTGGSAYSYDELKQLHNMLIQRGYTKIGIKPNRGAAGLGITTISHLEELQQLDQNMQSRLHEITNFLQEPYTYNGNSTLGVRVEGWLDSNANHPAKKLYDLGLCGYIQDDGSWTLVSTTCQDIEGVEHAANYHDPRSEAQRFMPIMQQYAEKIFTRAAADGVRGFIGLDGVAMQYTKKPTELAAEHYIGTGNGYTVIHVNEVNDRMTGQTHGGMIVHDLLGSSLPDDRVWWVGNASTANSVTPVDAAEYLDYIAEYEYNDKNSTGIIPVNLGMTALGKPQVLMIANTMQEIRQMIKIAKLEPEFATC